MSFDFLFQPAEQLDRLLEGLFAGATLPVALRPTPITWSP